MKIYLVITCFFLQQLTSNGEVCNLCKDVIVLLDNMLESNATRKEVEQALESVCDQAPASLKETVSYIWLLAVLPQNAKNTELLITLA